MSQLLLAARLALRGILAYRRRSIQTLIVVGFGATLIVLTDSFMQGFAASVMDKVLAANGHLSLTAPGYAAQREISPIDLFVPDLAVVRELLASDPALRAAETGSSSLVIAASIRSPGLVSDGERSVTATCLGIEPFWRGQIVPPLQDVARQVHGSFFSPRRGPGLLVSRRVADKLGARVGDRLMFLSSDRYGSFGVVELPLLGIFPRGATMGDEECLMDFGSMQTVTGLEGSATEISLWQMENRAGRSVLAGPRAPLTLIQRSAAIARASGLVAQGWSEISAPYAGMMQFLDLYLVIMYVVFAIVAAVGMTNTVLLSVQDRFRDLATLRVVALSRGGVSAMIAFESFFLGLLGAVAGTLLGGGVSFILERSGFMLHVELEAVASYMGSGLAPRFFLGRTAVIAAVSATVPVLASFLPITALHRITVREALGSV